MEDMYLVGYWDGTRMFINAAGFTEAYDIAFAKHPNKDISYITCISGQDALFGDPYEEMT